MFAINIMHFLNKIVYLFNKMKMKHTCCVQYLLKIKKM